MKYFIIDFLVNPESYSINSLVIEVNVSERIKMKSKFSNSFIHLLIIFKNSSENNYKRTNTIYTNK